MENDVCNIPQKLYVLGHPVAHSKSPVMYNAVYGKLGFPWEYRLMDCETPAEAKAFLAARDFLSINITTPYKPEALAAATARAASPCSATVTCARPKKAVPATGSARRCLKASRDCARSETAAHRSIRIRIDNLRITSICF